jgi:hypothetical protein
MRKLNTLNKEELLKVLKKNSKLEEKVFDDMFDNANYWNSEYLSCWKNKGVDYCIGYDRGTYFECTDKELFLDGLKVAQNNFGFLADKYNDIIVYVENLINKMNCLNCYSNYYDNNYERLENRIDELIEELESECYKRFMEEYECCFNNDYKEDYFYEFYVDSRMDNEDFYVDDNYVLYEHIEYEKSYQ